MKISIFGLGYVGCVSLGCIAQNGHTVVGVDVNSTKVDLINKGKATIIEKDIDRIVEQQFKEKRVSATDNYKLAILSTDITIICVGTPSTPEGHLNLSYIYSSAKQIGEALKEKQSFHIVVIRSTVLPGTNVKVGEIIEEISQKKRNIDFAVVSNPEFLREGSAVEDYFNPPLTLLGSDSVIAMDILEELYQKVNGPVEKVKIEIAEIIKYVNNSYHALKIVFANEVGNICKKLDVDSHEVMRIFGKDKQLNISEYYFKPGFAYGGSCLPKDLRALRTIAHDFYLESPVLESIEKSNSYHKTLALKLILDTGKQKIGFAGISFKQGTDDLRYSPSVDLIEQLLGKGKDVLIYDKNVTVSKLVGANKSYIDEKLPHISTLLTDSLEKLVEHSEVIVFPNKNDELESTYFPDNKVLIDFCRIEKFRNHPNYIGLNW